MSVVEFPRPRGEAGQPSFDRAFMCADLLQLTVQVGGKPANHITDEEAEALVSAIGAVNNEEAEALMALVQKCARTVMEK